MIPCQRCGNHAHVQIQRRMWNSSQLIGRPENLCADCYVRIFKEGTYALDELAILDPRIQLQILDQQRADLGHFIAGAARLLQRLSGTGEQQQRTTRGDDWTRR